ncbi:tRNA-dihydrouridine synthase C [Caloramator mitchellensis]|uniref:tRNA-dihydrouridine synthase n=1 Tax=Caloramator mitchellensis TaxID=908809 RepID=A0A0R3JT59_CALMK|nr:tRNA dihydrouridine synthase DusB [Caloramator mitchellensis]KRQ86667.1 tRNA-dihydrouridine synthase C [Caloramator mitchellensis]
MKIGNYTTNNDVFLAPMAGVTDKAFRIICKEYGCGMVYTEMVSSKGLFYGSKKTNFLLDIDEKEAPVIVQLFGSEPEIMGQMAEVVSQNSNVVSIDINMGCPAPKIVKNGEGSALMKNPTLAYNIVKNVVNMSSKPVSVKFRKGWDEANINAVEFAKMMEDAGASFIAVHGRTREQMYEGRADWDIIRKVKESVAIPVIGNGDVVDEKSAEQLFKTTGVDAILIGRGALGNPWIFKRINHYIETGEVLPEISIEEKFEVILKHLRMADEFKGRQGIIEMRKHIAWYLKGLKNSTHVKDMINKMDNRIEIEELLKKYMETLI